MSGAPPSIAATDGRVARGERTRAAIVAAFLDLLTEGTSRPRARDVADRAGVSVRSIFQHFEDLEALRADVVRTQGERIAPMLQMLDGSGDLEARIDELVLVRRRLYEHIAPLRRSVAGIEPTGAIQVGLADLHRQLRLQVSRQFADEMRAMGRTRSAPVLAALDAITSFEAWDQLRSAQGLSATAAGRAVAVAVTRLLS